MALKDFLNSGSGSVDSDDDEGWININNTTWSPERPGDTIEGELVEKKFNIGKWNHNLYVIKRGDGSCRDVNENEGIMEYYTHRSDGTSYASSSGGNGYGGNARYGENNSGYIHYVYIDTSKHAVNRNITTYNFDNNTTTTIISEYKPPTT